MVICAQEVIANSVRVRLEFSSDATRHLNVIPNGERLYNMCML